MARAYIYGTKKIDFGCEKQSMPVRNNKTTNLITIDLCPLQKGRNERVRSDITINDSVRDKTKIYGSVPSVEKAQTRIYQNKAIDLSFMIFLEKRYNKTKYKNAQTIPVKRKPNNDKF
jgi:hypothetical protein